MLEEHDDSYVHSTIRRAMRRWGAPGLAVAGIRVDSRVFRGCYGLADPAEGVAVTPQTRFAIGSITKSFTATVLARLVGCGLLDWDVPVRRYLPEFDLCDPTAGSRATLRDLLAHRTGLPSNDLIWFGHGPSLDEILERLPHVESTAPFRSRCQYQNMTFAAAAIVASRVMRTCWPELVRQELLAPLSLARTGFLPHGGSGDPGANLGDQWAVPHIGLGRRVRPIPWRQMRDGILPVGSMTSCLDDLVVFLRFHLAGGVHGGHRLLEANQLSALYEPQILVDYLVGEPIQDLMACGLGFFATSYRGLRVVGHLGVFDGFQSLLTFLPSAGIGTVVLGNCDAGSPVPRVATLTVRDLLLGLEPEPWTDRARETLSDRGRPPRRPRLRGRTPLPSHRWQDFVGSYVHRGAGTIQITLRSRRKSGARNGPRLDLTLNGRTHSLRHFAYEIFIPEDGHDNPQTPSRILFGYDFDGQIDRLGVLTSSEGAPIWFRRKDGGSADATQPIP